MTTILRNGTVVMAKKDGTAKIFVNKTAAQKVADQVGGTVYEPMIMFSRGFYVRPAASSIAEA